MRFFRDHFKLTPTVIVIAICLIYVCGVLWQNNGDPKTFVLIGTQFSEGDPQGTEGYDGQFAYQIALSPTGAAPYIDVPAYRYQRILYPLTARLLAVGQLAWIPWTLILVNVIAIGWGTWATEQLLHLLRVNRWYALAYGLYGGQLLALRTDLNEPLAQALVQGAILAWAKERPRWAIVAFALAALTKETTLIFLGAYMLYTLSQRQWRNFVLLSLSGIPFIVYQLFLWWWLGNFGIGSGGAGATSFSLIPLGGWLAILQINVLAFWLISLVVLPMSILPSLAGIWLSVRRLLAGVNHPFVLCLLLNSLVMLALPTSTFREPVAMLRLTQGLAVSMLLFAAYIRSWRTLNYAMFWLATNVLWVGGVTETG